MKTLLFGANGYVGKSLNADIRVGRADVDLLSYQAVYELLALHQPTHVISAASKHGSFKEMQHAHRGFLRENLIIDSNILEASANCNIQNVYILSSISGLPESDQESNEKMLSTGPVSHANFGYNFSKYASTQIVKSYQLDGFSNFRSFLLGNIYGYNERFYRNTNVVATLIKNMYKAKNSGANLELYGNGLDARCFTHLSDVRKILDIMIAQSHSDNEPVIISSSNSHTVKEIAYEIANSMEFHKEILFEDKTSNTYSVKNVNNSKLIGIIGPYTFRSLESGINETVREYLANART